MLVITAVALLGFASSPGGGPDTVAGGCADTPDSAMIQITGGKTCSDLAAAGRCTSNSLTATDDLEDLVATVMARNCKASCGGCGETRASRAYVVMGDEGDYACKEYGDGVFSMPLSKEAAEEKVCGTCFAQSGEFTIHDWNSVWNSRLEASHCGLGYMDMYELCDVMFC